MTRATVTKAHVESYADPIQLKQGERATLTGREDIWEGHRWLWAIAPDGREGWVPNTLLDADGYAGQDYSAMELSCNVGQTLMTGVRTHGWVWCTDDSAGQGWVPVQCLSSC